MNVWRSYRDGRAAGSSGSSEGQTVSHALGHRTRLSAREGAPGRLPEGTRVAETYVICRRLGSGGTGEVYLARDEWLERNVAIKLFRGGAEVSAFETELDALTTLNHPNVVEIFDRGIHEDRNFLVMAYIGGRSLRQSLDDDGPLGLVETYRMVESLAGGIDALHRAGLLHGDLKPDNILLRARPDGRGSPVIIDLGFSQQLDVHADKVAGSPAYVAPERLTGGPSQPTSDIYSLALIAHELLTGKTAMARADVSATIHAHLSPARPSILPRPGQPAWPEGLDAVLLSGYALNPEKRPTSARAFSEALYRALEPYLVVSVSARCPHCARSNIKIGEFCGDCGVEGLPTRCPACGNATDPCASTRCLHCDKSLFSGRSRRRPSRIVQKTAIGQPAVLALVGPALGEVGIRFGFEAEVQAAGGVLVAELGKMLVATFERTRGQPTATQNAVSVAQRTLAQLEGVDVREPGPQLAAGVECGTFDGGWQGVLHGRLRLSSDAARTALTLGWMGLQTGEPGVYVGTEAARVLPPGSHLEPGPGAGRVKSLGNAALRLPDPIDYWLHDLSGPGQHVLTVRADRSTLRAWGVLALAQGWARENAASVLVVSGRGHEQLEYGVARELLRNLLADRIDPAERNRRVATALRAEGYAHEAARLDAQSICAILDGRVAASVEWAPGQMLRTMWRVLDALLPERVVLAIAEAGRLTGFALQRLVEVVERRGPSACLVLGDSPTEQVPCGGAPWPVIDADAPVPDAVLRTLVAALPRLGKTERFATVVPALTGGRPSAIQDLFSLLSYLDSNDQAPDLVLDLLVDLAQRPSELQAARVTLLKHDERQCLAGIAALGEDTMLSVLSACMPKLDVAAHLEALSACGLVEVDYDRYPFEEVALNVVDPILSEWLVREDAARCSEIRRRARAACESLHGEISPDLSCRMAKIMVAEKDSGTAAVLIRDAARAFEVVDPWRALDHYRYAESLIRSGNGRDRLASVLLDDVVLAMTRLMGRYDDAERALERLEAASDDTSHSTLWAVTELSRAQALHRLGLGLEAIPVLESAIWSLTRTDHEAWLLAALCEELSFLMLANGDEEGALRVVTLYHNVSGNGAFAARPSLKLIDEDAGSINSIYDATTETFGESDVIFDQRREASSLRLGLLGVIAQVRRDRLGAAEQQLAALEAQVGRHPQARLAGMLAWAQAALALAHGERHLAIELLMAAAREMRRAGEDDAGVLILAKAFHRDASMATHAKELMEIADTLRPEGPDAHRRLADLRDLLAEVTPGVA